MKQAVVVIHGMGEQIPMETLTGFVDAVWTTDESRVDQGKPDPDTGETPRTKVRNASWSKPDPRNRSYELRVITTESASNGRRTDFYEYYWAHLIVDTTWAQVRAWIFELMLRNPFRDVPRGVRPVWILLWLLAIGGGVAFLLTLRPRLDGSVNGSWPGAIAVALGTAVLGWLLGFLVSYFGDVARYVKAKPLNVARRQEIRENGVQLLETLMGIRPDGTATGKRDYDRIVVVAHSLGTIVAYDILTHAFARVNTIVDPTVDPFPQTARQALEKLIRDAAAKPPTREESEDWIAGFQKAQADARKELNQTGNPWIVSDFITLGSPLTHAEFLLVRDRARLTEAKSQRILPTCPPALEYDRTTEQRHFTYRSLEVRGLGKDKEPGSPRVPHHAALFAYTRWSNIYSPHSLIAWGDIISGPLADAMGMEMDGRTISGIVDWPVMPAVAKEDTPFFTHTKYWRPYEWPPAWPNRHIGVLRGVLRLGER
ncbi:MAG TPA: hypothetical protein VFP12_17430 [Allosphingosinicella sp.]|nr:hypothetical protein [Allosphingosinicella sp.]